MPVTKRIVVLANSVKHHPGRCVAGRDVTGLAGGPLRAGAWTRPVSTVGEGELLPEHMLVAGGGGIRILDIFEVTLLSQGNDPSQPENWFINAGVPWNRVGKWPANQLGTLAESPPNLWLQPPPERSDRVAPDYIRAHPPHQSLYVIVPPRARLYRNQWEKYRLSFNFAGISYDFSVTDPLAQQRLTRDHGGQSGIDLEAPTVCVSLAPVFKGHHYKVAATIIW